MSTSALMSAVTASSIASAKRLYTSSIAVVRMGRGCMPSSAILRPMR